MATGVTSVDFIYMHSKYVKTQRLPADAVSSLLPRQRGTADYAALHCIRLYRSRREVLLIWEDTRNMHRVACCQGLEHLQIVMSLGIPRIPTAVPKDADVTLGLMGERVLAHSSHLPPSSSLMACDYLVS